MRLKITLILFIITTICFKAYAQNQNISFEAITSKKKAGINETLRVDFKMNKDGDNFSPPNFDGFRVVGGPNQSISNSWINGKKTFSKVYSYFISPLKKGSLSIGQATVEIDDQIYKTLAIKVIVSESVNINSDPNNSNYLVNENLHLVAEISNVNPYLNQAISVIYKLYFSPQINVTNVAEIDSPEYVDFWSHSIKIPRLQIERGIYKGDSYNYVIWKKIVLYPQKAGKLNILPLSLDVSVDVPTNKRDFFGNRIYSQVPKTVAAGKRIIDVNPLPENAPLNFSGAVGDFKIELFTSKTELNASESVQATIKVKGTGNLKLFSAPEISVPSSLEKYDPEHKENVKTNLKGMLGEITDTYTLVPQFKGKYPISPIEFSYFNPQTKSYKSIFTNEVIINVMDGPSAAFENTESISEKQQLANNISGTINQFKFIKTNPKLELIKKKQFIYSLEFYSLIFIPVLILFLIIVFVKSKKSTNADIKGVKSRRANKLAKKYLYEAKKNLKKKELFYIALEKALHNFLKSKLLIETLDYDKEKIKNLLIEKNIEITTIDLFIEIIKNCEYARYSPASNVAINKDYENSVKVILEIDKQI